MNHNGFFHIQLFHDDYLNDLMLPDDHDENLDDEEAVCDTSADWLGLSDSTVPSSPLSKARR